MPVSIRFPLPLLEQIKEAVRMMPGSSQHDVIRLATEIGLVRLRKLHWRLAEVIDAAAESPRPGRTFAGDPHDSAKRKYLTEMPLHLRPYDPRPPVELTL